MSRTSNDIYINGVLVNGFDYTRQAWVVDGFYVSCHHAQPNPLTGRPTPCNCYGRYHSGEPSLATFKTDQDAFLNAPAPVSYVEVKQ